MTRLKELVLFSVGLLVGWFAWMVAGPKVECPQCYAATAEPSQGDTLEDVIEQGKTVESELRMPTAWDSGPIDFRIVYIPTPVSGNVEELERAYDAAQATITELRSGYSEQVLAYQKQIEQLESNLRFETQTLNGTIADRDQLKQALKQLRTD